MAHRSGRNERARQRRPPHQRQGVREPQPADPGSRRQAEAAELAPENEGRRGGTGKREREREREREEAESPLAEGAGGDRTP